MPRTLLRPHFLLGAWLIEQREQKKDLATKYMSIQMTRIGVGAHGSSRYTQYFVKNVLCRRGIMLTLMLLSRQQNPKRREMLNPRTPLFISHDLFLPTRDPL